MCGSKNYTYGDSVWKDKLTKYGSYNITYDEIGNPINYRNGKTFSWKNGRWLASTTLSDNTTVTYQYDANGMRTKKTIGSTVTNYYYDSNNNLIGLKSGSDVAFFYYDADNSSVSMKYNNNMYYYVKNLQGDIVKILDSNGSAVASYNYDAWGTITGKTVNNTTIDTLSPFRYRGYVYDTDTGLYYLKSRYYDPQTGRFINADDTAFIGATGTVLSGNLFAYCENNPFNNCDYYGNYTQTVTDNKNDNTLCISLLTKKGKKNKKSFTIIYKANGGIGQYMANTIVNYGEKKRLRGRTYHKTYYVFKGWSAYRKSDKKWLCYDILHKSQKKWLTEKQLKRKRNYEKYLYANKQYVAKLSSVNDDKIYMYANWSKKVYVKNDYEDYSINVIGDDELFPYRIDFHCTYVDKYYLSKEKITHFYRSVYVSAKSTNNNGNYKCGSSDLVYVDEDGNTLVDFDMKRVDDYLSPGDLIYFYYKENSKSVSYSRNNRNMGKFSIYTYKIAATKNWSMTVNYKLSH